MHKRIGIVQTLNENRNGFLNKECSTVDQTGDIYYADLSPVVGSEQGGVRPVLIVQNDMGNKHSPTVIAAAITSQRGESKASNHIEVSADGSGLAKFNCFIGTDPNR